MRLKTYLHEKKITIPDFAGSIGVSVQAAHRYVNGERVPQLEIMDRIVRVTEEEVQPNDLIAARREAMAAAA